MIMNRIKQEQTATLMYAIYYTAVVQSGNVLCRILKIMLTNHINGYGTPGSDTIRYEMLF